MDDRFLLDGVYVTGHDPAVDQEVELSAYDPPDPAQAHLAFPQLAEPRARSALYLPGRKVAEQLGGLARGFCEARQRGHVVLETALLALSFAGASLGLVTWGKLL